MIGKDVEIRLRLGNSKRSRLERSLVVDAFVNSLGLSIGGYRGKDTIRTDSISEPALVNVRVQPHLENSAIVDLVLRLAANCNAEIEGAVKITPVADVKPPPSGYFE